MSRWCAKVIGITAATLAAMLWTGTATGQDAISCLIPARWAAGQTVNGPSVTGLQRSLSPRLTFDVTHRAISLGIANSDYSTSRAYVNYAVPERSGGGEFGWTGTIEDDREGQAFQRLRLVAGGYKKVQIAPKRFLTAALHLGYGRRAWRNMGIWDSQFLQNPAAPELAESGESSGADPQHYLETGLELAYQSQQATAAYRMLHAPVDQGFFAYTEDSYTLRHTVFLSRWQDIETGGVPLRNLTWVEWEGQAGARLASIGTLFTTTLGEDSQFTELKSAMRIGLGAIYRSTRQVAPVFSCQFDRRWTVWLAPEIAVGSESIRSGWNAGMRVQLL
jgi:hypothetical protein